MSQVYLIRVSRLEASLLASIAAIGGCVLLAFVELDLYLVSAVLLLWLLGIRFCLALTRAPELYLRFDPLRAQVALEARGQTHFYSKYKVYPSRWFAILKLIDTGNNRTLFLNPARFESDSTWRGFRRELSSMDGRRAD